MRTAVACVALLLLTQSAEAFTPNTTPLTSTQKNIERAGTGLAIALPIAAAGIVHGHVFPYSPRPGTPAAGAPAQVAEAEKDRRLQELQALLRQQQDAFNASCVGRSMPVLFTGHGRHPGQMAGRSPYLQPVHLSGPASLIGTETMVTIAAAFPNSLSAQLSHPLAQELTPA